MLEWAFSSPTWSALGASLAIPPGAIGWVLIGIVAIALFDAMRKPKVLFGTRPPHRLPSTLPILENTIDMIRASSRIHDWTVSAMEDFNFEPYTAKCIGAPYMTMLCSPEAFEDVFKTHFDAFPKGDFQTGNLQDLLGNGIFAVDGEKWAAQRKTASRLFTMRALRDSMTSTIQKHSVVLHEIFERASASGEPIDLFKLFNRFTIEAFAEIGFGVTMGCLDSEEEHPFQRAFDSAQRRLVLRFLRPNWFWKGQRLLGIGGEGQLRRDMDVINTTVLDIIHKSMAHRHQSHQAVDLHSTEGAAGESKNDIVSLFLDNYAAIMGGDSSDPFDPIFLRDIVINFLIAGRDTTAQALSWFFYCLDQNPRVADRIREEVAEKLPELFDRTKSSIPSMENVSRLVYLEAALKETLRLYPSVPVSTKDAVRDVVLSDGTPIPKGSTVMLMFYAMGRNPNVWGPDAKEFKPERWIDTSSKEPKILSASAFKFIAFNAGPRMCLGMNLAMLEMKLIVASVLSRFSVKLTQPEEVTYDVSVTLPIKGALLAHVEQLRTSAAA